MLHKLSKLDMDIVTVWHNERNYKEHLILRETLELVEPNKNWNFIAIDNSVENRGFARACNLGSVKGQSPVIGFLNPDTFIRGPFINKVKEIFEDKQIVVTGNRFGKDQKELRHWKVKDWVCGASMFVRRDFFEEYNGFDEQFVWGWEETDLIKRAEILGYKVLSFELPIEHSSPRHDNLVDAEYKRTNFTQGAALFHRKWGY